MCNLHLQGASTLVSSSVDFRPWKWKWYVPPKRGFTYGIHGALSRKTSGFLFSVAKTSNATQINICGTWYKQCGGGGRGSVVVEALCYKPNVQGCKNRWGSWILSMYLILPAALGHEVYLLTEVMNRDGRKGFWAVERDRCLRQTTLLSSVNRLPRQYWIFNISQL
jgi:hypothetical protein